MTMLLTLNLPPALEEDLIDYLLSLEFVQGFSSYHVMGHGEHDNLSIAEQVSGRRHRLQFELLLNDGAVADQVVSGLSGQVGPDIRYWQQPVNGVGTT